MQKSRRRRRVGKARARARAINHTISRAHQRRAARVTRESARDRRRDVADLRCVYTEVNRHRESRKL